MITGVHTMSYSSKASELPALIRDKLGFPCTDVGDGWLIFNLLRRCFCLGRRAAFTPLYARLAIAFKSFLKLHNHER